MRKAAIILIIILLILVAGIGAFIVTTLMPSRAQAQDSNTYPYSIGGDILTNLKGGGHYVKANIIIEVNNKDDLKILEKNNHRIRDRIIEILGNVDEDATKDPEFRKDLRDHIKEDLGDIVGNDKIKGVYFNDFIIQ